MNSNTLARFFKIYPLVWLVFLYVACRLTLLLMTHPHYLFVQTLDELYRGMAAKEILEGLRMPLLEYRPENYSGGWLVVSIIAAGFFKLFGPTVFSLKLVPLVFSALALVFWYLVLSRHSSQQTALYFSLLFIFSPFSFASFTLIPLGDHAETMLFTGLSLLLFFKILHQKENSWTIYALLGLVAGFGVWFAYIYGITVMAMLIFWLLHDRNVFVRRGFALFALFFLIGFSPWIVFNLNNNFSGLFIHGVPFWAHFRWNHFQESLANYWTLTGLFPTLRSPESWPLTPVYSLLFLGIISSHAIFTLWNRPSVKDLYVFSMLYLVLFIAVLLSSYFFSLSYLIPAFPFFFFLAAHSLAEGERRFPPRYRKIPLFFLTALIGGGIYSQTHRFSIPRAGQALRTKGYSYFTAASVPICNDFDCVARRYQTLKPKLDPESLHELSVGAAFDLAGLILPFKNLSEEVDRIQSFNVPPFENYFYYFLGMAALSRNHYHLPSAVEAIEFLKIRSPRFYNLAWRGIALELGYGPADTLIEKPDEFAREIPSSVVSHYWRGVGRELGKYLCARNPSLAGFEESLRDLLKRMDRHHQEDILQGVGASLYVEWSLNPARPPFRPKEIEQFPEEFHHALFQGAGIAFIEDTRTDLAISSNNWLEEAFTESLEPQNQRYFEEGKNTVSKYFVVPEAG